MARSHKEGSPEEGVKADIIPDLSNYKHHKEGEFNCEAEVIIDGVLTCCLHDPIIGTWKYVPKRGSS